MADADGTGFGARLRLARQTRGLSQQQLAGMAGVARQTISMIESGLSDPSLRNALALARILGMTVEEIFEPVSPVPPVVVAPVAPLGGEGARVALADGRGLRRAAAARDGSGWGWVLACWRAGQRGWRRGSGKAGPADRATTADLADRGL